MANIARIQELANRMQTDLTELQSLLKEPEDQTLKANSAEPLPENDFEVLKKALESDRWPEAVNPNLLANPESEQDKTARGRGTVEMLVDDALQDVKFLDFGCGEGYSANYVANHKGARLSVGYDIRSQNWEHFEKRDNLLFTTSYEKIKEQGPYDVIMIYDVLDHLVVEDPLIAIAKARDVLSEKGRIYVRLHPWTSRHATHLYHDLNKAYVHLVFSPEELHKLIGVSKYSEFSLGVKEPIETYQRYFWHSCLQIIDRKDIRVPVEPFFKIPKIADRITQNVGLGRFPEEEMSISFVNFVLERPGTA